MAIATNTKTNASSSVSFVNDDNLRTSSTFQPKKREPFPASFRGDNGSRATLSRQQRDSSSKVAVATQRQKYQQRHQQRNISSSERIKYLRRLGIESPSALTVDNQRTVSRNENNISNRSILGDVHVYTEPLKYKNDSEDTTISIWQSLFVNKNNNDGDNEKSTSNSQTTTSASDLIKPLSLSSSLSSSDGDNNTANNTENNNNNSKKNKPQAISFNDTVNVLPIPKREEYSDRIKHYLWTPVNELNLMAYRNTIEFASEGWDWQTVVEDDGMYVCAISGEKIHPIHLEAERGGADDDDDEGKHYTENDEKEDDKQ